MLLKVEHLRKEYENVTPLGDVNCEIERGDVISVIGPSGTGKSTLINCFNRLEEPTSGKIWFDGELITGKGADLSKLRRRMGMVFQSFNLFPHLTCAENIMLAPVELLHRPKQMAYDRAIELLDSVGLREKAESYPDELSGGQKQRVAIVRALAMDPEMILFDEPTSALDPTMVGEVLAVIRELAAKKMTMVIVTHEMKFAHDVSTRVFYMDEGTVYEEGTPDEIFGNPKREKTRQFINRLKVLRCRIEPDKFDFADMNRKINEYARHHMIPADTLVRLYRLSEELCVQLILPKIDKKTAIDFSFEYNSDTRSVNMAVRYGGIRFNPLEHGDEISLAIVRSSATDIDYTYNGENVLELKLN